MKKPQLNQTHLRQLYEDGKEMIWSYNTLYQIGYSQAQQTYYLMKIHQRSAPVGVTKRGWHMAMTPEQASRY